MFKGKICFAAALAAMAMPLLSVNGGEEYPELPRRITGETDEARADMAARTLKRRDLFVRFFVTCLKRLKGEFHDIKVGGPALCRMKPDYFTAILKACKEAGVAPDFISWHHYTSKPDVIMNAIRDARKLCDDFGFKNCELIIDEWHYLPPKGWAGIRSADPDVQTEVWSGPASHNGIDSSCFNLTVLSRMQTSALDSNSAAYLVTF